MAKEDPVLTLESHGNVVVARMRRGVTNALGPELIGSLGRVVAQAREDPAIRALVLASANAKFFSIGLDIPALLNWSQGEFQAFLTEFSRLCLDLYSLPKPTVAAISGHATAGGCILALGCDYRLIATGRKLIGLNEIRLGVPVPYVADRILAALVGQYNARLITDGGEFLPPDRALELRLVDRVVPEGDLMMECLQHARSLAEMPGQAYAQIKANRVGPVLAEIEAGLQEKNLEFVRAWYSPEARQRLQEAAVKF